jgi:hypothetical protein
MGKKSELTGCQVLVDIHIPDARCLIARAGDNETAVARELERVNLLFMAVKDVADAFRGDVPDLVLTVNID